MIQNIENIRKVYWIQGINELKIIVKRLPKVLHFKELPDGSLKIFTKEGIFMVRFKGEKKVVRIGEKLRELGSFLETHKDGAHIPDWEFVGLFLGYLPTKKGKKDIVYFIDENGEVKKVGIFQIYGDLKYHLKADALDQFDIVYIKYKGMVKIDKIKTKNVYDIKVYSAVDNKDYVQGILKKAKVDDDIVDFFKGIIEKIKSGKEVFEEFEKEKGNNEEVPF